MIIVAQLAVLPYVPFRVAVGAGFLGDCREIAGVAMRVEVVVTAREIGFRVELMTPPATLLGFPEISRLGIEQPQVNAVREIEVLW